jgi:hypothetical protein
VHCGQVKNGIYQEGRKVSVSKIAKRLNLTNKKFQADGSVLQKIERFKK